MSLIECLLLLLLFVVVAISVDIYIALNWHKCPRCGKKMKLSHIHEEYGHHYYKFHCPYCGAWDEIEAEEFTNPK